jgi:hypothetical protein
LSCDFRFKLWKPLIEMFGKTYVRLKVVRFRSDPFSDLRKWELRILGCPFFLLEIYMMQNVFVFIFPAICCACPLWTIIQLWLYKNWKLLHPMLSSLNLPRCLLHQSALIDYYRYGRCPYMFFFLNIYVIMEKYMSGRQHTY